MKTIYSSEAAFKGGLSIFLAGPTPRKQEVASWRPEALEILRELGFKGTVLIPERTDWTVKFEYLDQVEWEYQGLTNATVVVFWVPRNMETMPALTTNVEFGFWMARNPRKVVYGRPQGAPSTGYLDWMCKKFTRRKAASSLREVLVKAVKMAAKPGKKTKTGSKARRSR